MPFSADANWPQGLLNIFEVSRNKNAPLGSRYYGPYDRLFNYAVVEGSFTFLLAPQASPDEVNRRDAVDFVCSMVALNQEQKPVLIAEIKDDKWANSPDKRQMADTQMRQRYDQILADCPIPHLYGVSLLGTSLLVYRGDKATGAIIPQFVDRPDKNRILPSEFLEGLWDSDILSQNGFDWMKRIVTYIKTQTANVGQ